MDYDAFDAILHHIFKQTQGDAWFRPNEESTSAGVCLRVATQPSPHFRVFPYEHLALAPFEAAVRQLNPAVAVKVRSAAVHAALATVTEDEVAIYVDVNTRIQVLEEMRLLGKADKEQCAAFIRDERVLVVWADNIDDIIPLCNELEDKLIKLVWRARPPYSASSSASMITSGSVGSMGVLPRVTSSLIERSPLSPNNPTSPIPGSASATGSGIGIEADVTDEKGLIVVGGTGAESLGYNKEDPNGALAREAATTTKPAKRSWFGWRSTGEKQVKDRELEEGDGAKEERPIRLFAPVYGGLGAGLSIFFIGSGITILLQEWVLDGSLIRFALLATAPFLFCVSLFFSLQVITNLSFVMGPVAQFHENSKYYSAQPPRANKSVDSALPHVSIQMPVYKESLKETIAPSVYSLKKAMQTYARQGGTSSIFINDDGMQLISEADRLARQEFYADHGIGWVARPKHSDEPDGFKRAGRFKKASNMNYALDVSLRLEGVLRRMEEEERERRRVRRLEKIARRVDAGEDPASMNVNVDDEELWDDEIGEMDEFGAVGSMEEEENKEEKALQIALEELYEETGSKWRPWAKNAKSIRMGELILIVDSDTVVPEDCLRDAARELAECPEVAIIQHESDVVQVAHHYFENGIAHFTRRINRCISMACANGEVAPFVGHNAFLRWSALQDAAFVDPLDGKKKIWSEANVSEDFDMALRLQLAGYIIRWASYSKGGFKEGVSLTCDDELNRWQKYAFGCNELLFNPLIKWFTKGPINKQLHIFIWSDAPVHYKISMLSYMFSYYGLAAAMTLSVINYLILGFSLPIDGFYEHSFEIWLACTVVFPGAGNLGFTLLEYRLGTRSLMDALIENVTWIPFFFFFFGGLSVHLSQALLAHLFSYNITWGATKKEVEKSNFFLEVPKILRRFWLSLVVSILLVAAMIVLSTGLVPEGWRVIPSADWAVIFPLAVVVGCHVLYPIVLNPWLMIFSY